MDFPPPLANGLRTDHPVPGLPFVDDSHLDLHDPRAIEAVGREAGHGMWGRYDEQGEGWLAFTTDPYRHDLGWAVRYHPDHGRTVLVYTDAGAASVHMKWWNDTLLWRAGGYWWGGTTWYRPKQIWNGATEEYEHRRASGAITVTAADRIDGTTDPARGAVVKISNLDIQAPLQGRWQDHLALWAQHRAHEPRSLPLDQCVITLSAPELAPDELVGVTEMAAAGEVAASTLRAYISRGEGEVPLPQASPGGRNAWSLPVVREWAEQRHRSPESVAQTLADKDSEVSLSLGEGEVMRRFSASFFSRLWDNPDRRKKWALRHRTEESVRQVSDQLAWDVAKSLDKIIPIEALTGTIRHAVLDELAYSQDNRSKTTRNPGTEVGFYGIGIQVATMLDWLVRHHPTQAQHTIDSIVGSAQRRLDIPREVTARSLRTALSLDGKLDEDVRNEFLDKVLGPLR